MRPVLTLAAVFGLALALTVPAAAKQQRAANTSQPEAPKQIEVTADQSLEWYQDQHLYVARGNAKAVRGDMTIYADLLTAHQRETPPATGQAKPAAQPGPDTNSGDIDKMTAEGNVRVITSKDHVTGDHGVYDTDKHVMVMTGNNLMYQTEKETVTARDSLEYYEGTQEAVARGHAVAVGNDRHVEGDVLTAQFRTAPNGENQLWKMTALGHVTITTKNDVTHGEHAIYDVARNMAIVTGNVRITRADGTELTGDVGEVDFASNQSRLLNAGGGRVRALLTPRETESKTKTAAPAASQAASP